MIKLTPKMREVLEKADLDKGEINNVPLATMYGLQKRELILPGQANWGSNMSQQTSCGGSFPWYGKVRLTTAGLRAVRTAQGLRADV